MRRGGQPTQSRRHGGDAGHGQRPGGRYAGARGYETIAERQGKPGQTRIGPSVRYTTGCGYGNYWDPCRKRYCGFYYPAPVTRCYVPYGFYGGSTTVYIDTSESVREEYVVERYETVQAPQPNEDQQVQAAAGSAAAERYMREATELFMGGEYPEAARRFRLAAIAAPDQSGPLFALGQSLIALENYPYAAKVIRRAIDLDGSLVNEGGDLVGVYKSREEFDRVTNAIRARIKERPEELNLRFLLGIQQYFSGDPAARDTLGALVLDNGTDRMASMLLAAAEKRFKASADLPEID